MKNKKIKFVAMFIALVIVMLTFAGCGGDNLTDHTDQGMSESKQESNTPTDSSEKTDVQPKTLEQELLKKRDIAFDNSDYKKFTGGEGLLDSKTLFSNRTDIIAAADTASGSVFIAGNKIYKYSCKDPLSGGKNCMEVGVLPKGTAEDLFCFDDMTLGGVWLELYYAENNGKYKMEAVTYDGPYTVDDYYANRDYTFSKLYLCENGTQTQIDGAAFLKDVKQYTKCKSGWFYLLLTEDGLYKMRKNNGKTYLYKMELPELEGDEKIIRIYNCNIIMTDRAYYEVFDFSDLGTTNDNVNNKNYSPDYRLKKIEFLDEYYDEVLTISQTHLITKDYTMLPLSELTLPEDDSAERKITDKYICGRIRQWTEKS